jgi:hypothetical protein
MNYKLKRGSIFLTSIFFSNLRSSYSFNNDFLQKS